MTAPSTAPAPDLLTLRLHWVNRIQQLRAAPGEHAFHVLAALALLGVAILALYPALQRVAAWQPQHVHIAGATVLLFALLQFAARGAAQRCKSSMTEGWLATSAWSVQGRLAALRRRVLHDALLHLLLLSALLLLWQLMRTGALPHLLWLALATLWCSVPPVALWLWTRKLDAAATTRPNTVLAAASVPAGLGGRDLLQHGWRAPPLRSQRRQALLALLLLPGGMSGLLGQVVLILLCVLLWGGRCLTHYRETVFASSRWLRVTVAPPTWLAGALLPALSWRMALVLGIATLSLYAAGAPVLWLILALLAALALLSLSCLLVLVHRERPRACRLAIRVQCLALLLLVQSLPPAALLVWIFLMLRALRALRGSISRLP